MTHPNVSRSVAKCGAAVCLRDPYSQDDSILGAMFLLENVLDMKITRGSHTQENKIR